MFVFCIWQLSGIMGLGFPVTLSAFCSRTTPPPVPAAYPRMKSNHSPGCDDRIFPGLGIPARAFLLVVEVEIAKSG